MTPRDSGTTSTDRERMVERQLRRRGIHDERVLAAMAEVPRELFLPEDQRRRAYRDGAVRIGEGQTMSQPWIVACMAQLLELGYDNVVVRVGDGSRGAPERAPFGGISVTATARDNPPAALLEQLAPGAALVCPVERGGHELLMRFRDGEEEAVTGVRFVPLVTD